MIIILLLYSISVYQFYLTIFHSILFFVCLAFISVYVDDSCMICTIMLMRMGMWRKTYCYFPCLVKSLLVIPEKKIILGAIFVFNHVNRVGKIFFLLYYHISMQSIYIWKKRKQYPSTNNHNEILQSKKSRLLPLFMWISREQNSHDNLWFALRHPKRRKMYDNVVFFALFCYHRYNSRSTLGG